MRTFLIILQLAATGSDAYFTRRNFGHGFKEHDPLARPFVKNTPTLVISASAFAGAAIYLPHLLEKHGHSKEALALRIAGIATSTSGAIESAHNYKER